MQPIDSQMASRNSASVPTDDLGPDVAAPVVRDVERWMERAVIGLNLCPFAKSVHAKKQIRYVVSATSDERMLLSELADELNGLDASDPQERDTTLLIVPRGYADFWGFQSFVQRGEKMLRRIGLEGILQIAHFHPQFEFAGTAPDDITNFTNRAPYPILHLLRESSIDRAVAAIPDADSIYEKNMQTLNDLGLDGWNALGVGPSGASVNADGTLRGAEDAVAAPQNIALGNAK